MNKEKMKKILEQIRSKANGNNVAKASVEETAVENTNTRSTTQGKKEYEVALNTSVASLTTYSYQTAPDDETIVGSGGAIIGLMPPNYYFAEFHMTKTSVENMWALTEDELRECYLSLYPENLSSGYCTFTIVNSEGDTVGTWNNNDGGKIKLLVENVYDYSTEEVYFRLMPTRGINGMVGFPVEAVKLKKNTPFMKNAYYGNETQENLGNQLQIMDIYIPKNEDETYKEGPFPAVITIHGGNWSVDTGVTKEYYNYMTEFITKDCECVHVNMEYRRLGSGGGLNNTKAPYLQMLDDIQAVIDFISDEETAAAYHINPNKIALMGHSAGGHLALLYAYKSKISGQDGIESAIPVSLVISEAGPTDFTNFEGINTNNVDIRNGFMLSLAQLSALTGAEYTIDNYENNTEYPGGWEDASPIYYVSTNQGNNFPYTILAYGSNVNTPQGNNPFISGDGTVPYSQATSLVEELDPTFEDTSNGSETNASQVIEGENCTLFKLYSVGHNTFGEGNGKVVYPNTSVGGNLEEVIDAYYQKIQEELT